MERCVRLYNIFSNIIIMGLDLYDKRAGVFGNVKLIVPYMMIIQAYYIQVAFKPGNVKHLHLQTE